MKTNGLFFLFFSALAFFPSSLNGQNAGIKLTKIKIRRHDQPTVKGFLFKVNEDALIILKNKQSAKGFLIDENCELCDTIPTYQIKNIAVKEKKIFYPVYLMIASGLGLTLIAVADNTPNPDGLNGKDIAKVYTFLGLMAGSIFDLSRLLGHGKEFINGRIDEQVLTKLKAKSAAYMFNKKRKKQQDSLSSILTKIEKTKKRHRKPINIYTKDKKVVSGYIIGQKDDKLLLGLDKKKVVEYRNNPPNQLNEISLEDIFYYDFGKR